MGIIKNQTISGTIYTYIGVAIGFITTGLLMPHLLSTDEIGVLNLIVSYATLFAIFANLGTVNTTVRNFPFFRSVERQHNGFLFIMFAINVLGFLLLSVFLYFWTPYLIKNSAENSAIFIDYIGYLVPFTVVIQLFNILDAYKRVLYKALMPTVLKELIQRILILGVLIAYYFLKFNFSGFVFFYFIAFLFPTVYLFISLLSEKQLYLRPQLNFLDKPKINSIVSVSFFGIFTGVSGILLNSIDKFMVNHFIGVSATGVYSTGFIFGTLVVLPSRMLKKVAGTILAEAWKEKNKKEVLDIYKQSSLNQYLIGALLFMGIWLNSESLLTFLPLEYAALTVVIFFIGLANLLEMTSGVSVNIIAISESYKYNTLFVLIMLLFLIAGNYIFIQFFGIYGAALATLIATFVFNVLKIIFLKVKYNLQPFSKNHIKLTLVILLTIGVNYFIPRFDNAYLDIIIRSFIITITYGSQILLFSISEEVNSIVKKIIRR